MSLSQDRRRLRQRVRQRQRLRQRQRPRQRARQRFSRRSSPFGGRLVLVHRLPSGLVCSISPP